MVTLRLVILGSNVDDLRVFVSYSHDSDEHSERVRALADRLRADGVDAVLDRYNNAPVEGWPRWMDGELKRADFVLLVCTETYLRRVEGREEPGKGHGVLWEGHLVYQHLYNAGLVNQRFIPVLLAGADSTNIPTPLQGVPNYRPDTEEGYEQLYRRLTNQPETIAPVLGKRKSLPAKPTSSPGPAGTPVSAATGRQDPRDSNRGLKFVSIGIHHRSDKYWREGECSEHCSEISNKAAQYFHMTVFEPDSDFWKEHTDPVNADPLFDITVKNESGRLLIFRKVGIVISVVANENYLWGIPTAVEIPVSVNYAVKVPNLRERFQDAFDGYGLKPQRLDEVVWMRVPDPYAIEPEAPFRYTLRLENYCENMPNHALLQMWCETDHGDFRSGEIFLLRY
jgi:hypothetical protein